MAFTWGSDAMVVTDDMTAYTPVGTGNYANIIGTYSGNDDVSGLGLWIDNVDRADVDLANNLTTDPRNDYVFSVGQGGTGAQDCGKYAIGLPNEVLLPCYIDNAQVYLFELTSDDRADIYTNSSVPTRASITDLHAGDSVDIRFKSCNGVGCSSWSSNATATTYEDSSGAVTHT